MYYLETEHWDNSCSRIYWDGSARYELQILEGDQWVLIDCFICYDYDDPHDALDYARDMFSIWHQSEAAYSYSYTY